MPNGPATHHHHPPRDMEHHPVPFPLGPGSPSKTLPNDPVHTPKLMPNGPALHTSIPLPNGPGHFTPNTNNPPTKRDTYKILCTGNLDSKIRTCNKESTNTDLNGYWCGANCKCDKFGNMSCDDKKALGCSKEVLTASCGAVVEDWKCACVRA